MSMATRLRITQKGRDVRRVAASLTAYAFIGCLGAAALWVCLSIAINTAHSLTGG
jgi:hypothetical protein